MLLGISSDLLENVLEGTGHDTFLDGVSMNTSNGMGLTSTCLSIGEDCSIITLNDVLTNWVGCLNEDVFLLRARRIDTN